MAYQVALPSSRSVKQHYRIWPALLAFGAVVNACDATAQAAGHNSRQREAIIERDTKACTIPYQHIYKSAFADHSWGHENLILEGGYTEDMMGRVLRGDFMDDALTVAQMVPESAKVQTNVISTWQRIGSRTTQPVGVYSQCNVALDGAACWGLNPVVNDTDIDGTVHFGTSLYGLELDTNVRSESTAGASLFFGSDMSAQPANLGVMHVPAPRSRGHFTYNYGIWFDDGSVQQIGVHLGAQRGSYASSGSQVLEFKSHNVYSGDHSTFIFTDDSGSLHLEDKLGSTNSDDTRLAPSGMSITSESAYLSMGSPHKAGVPHLDFRSSGTSSDYDVRIESVGGTTEVGHGKLRVSASEIDLSVVRTDKLAISQSTPASSRDACIAGQIWSDDNYLYVCGRTGQIKRASLKAF